MTFVGELLDLKEAALRLRMHPETLRRKYREGRISAARPGNKLLFTETDLAAFVERSRVKRVGV